MLSIGLCTSIRNTLTYSGLVVVAVVPQFKSNACNTTANKGSVSFTTVGKGSKKTSLYLVSNDTMFHSVANNIKRIN